MNTSVAIAAYRATRQQMRFTKLHWGVANAIGIQSALFIEIIQDWCDNNMIHQRKQYFHNGHWWTRGTYQEWETKYPSLGSARTLQRLLLKLESDEYVLSDQFNKGKDNTKFYRVNEEKIGELYLQAIEEFRKSNVPNWHDDSEVSNSACQFGITQSANLAQSYIDKQISKTDQEITPPTPQRGERVEDGENLEQSDQSIPESTAALLIQPELLVQTNNPSCSSIVPAAFDKPEQLKKATDEQIKVWFLEVYQQEKPSNFTEHKEISSAHLKKIKQLIKEHPQDAIARFRDALIWVREQKDGWWRDSAFSLGNLMSNGKIPDFADKHATAMTHDRAYRDRVEGRAPSKDLKRIIPDAIASQSEYEEAYEVEQRKQELIEVYDYRPALARLRRF